jgi:hypothetical protein
MKADLLGIRLGDFGHAMAALKSGLGQLPSRPDCAKGHHFFAQHHLQGNKVTSGACDVILSPDRRRGETAMPRFLAVYTMKPEALASFRSKPKAEQDAIDAAGVPAWEAWEERNAASILDRGGMVGKTTRVTRDGVAKAVNPFCGYLVVEAESIEVAARLFEDHPHLTFFPGDGVDIMPFLT